MDFRNPHFAEPGWLWVAALAPVVLVLLYRYAAVARKKQLALFAVPTLLAGLTRSHSRGRRVLKNALLVLAAAGVGLALARPQWGETTETTEVLGEDVLFVLDCSKSMLATDVQPGRLERSRYAILDFVQQHGRGRVGLIAFAGQAFLQCPLTFDYDAFRESLLAVDEKSIPVPGTDIGRALEEASFAMDKNDRRKIIVLVTDGEDLEKTGVTTATALAEKGIVVYAVGVGTIAGSPIHFMNDQGVSEILKDNEGREVTSRLDEPTLTAIAQATRGSYRRLGAGEGLDQVRRIVETSMNPHESPRLRKLGVDRFHLPVAIVTVLLVLESLIGTRRNLRQHTA